MCISTRITTRDGYQLLLPSYNIITYYYACIINLYSPSRFQFLKIPTRLPRKRLSRFGRGVFSKTYQRVFVLHLLHHRRPTGNNNNNISAFARYKLVRIILYYIRSEDHPHLYPFVSRDKTYTSPSRLYTYIRTIWIPSTPPACGCVGANYIRSDRIYANPPREPADYHNRATGRDKNMYSPPSTNNTPIIIYYRTAAVGRPAVV